MHSGQFSILISMKMIMDHSKNGSWITPFKKFSRLRVKSLFRIELIEKDKYFIKAEPHRQAP